MFAAVWPPPDVLDAIADTVARLTPVAPESLRWTRPEQWHVTLAFLGARDLHTTVEQFRRARLPSGPVTVAVGPETGRFGRRIVHVPVTGLDGMAAAVQAVLPGDDDRPFHGHVTLARVDQRRRRHGGRDSGAGGERAGSGPVGRSVDLSSVVGVPLAASFLCSEVTLVQSHLGQGPARYEVLDRLAV